MLIPSFGYTTRMIRKANGDPNMEVVNYTYDNHGRSMGVVGANNYISNYDYDDNGRLVGVTYPNNLDLDMVFVPWDEPVNGGRLYQKTATFTFNARKVLDLAYSYDTIGNIDTLSDRYSMEEWTFTYDDPNRIKTLSTAQSLFHRDLLEIYHEKYTF